MSAPSFARLGPDERQAAYATLTLAFAADPCERWLYPGADAYLTHFPRFLAAFGGRAFETGTAWGVGGTLAASLWLPPGAEPDGEAIVEVLAGSVDPAKHEDMYAVLAQMEAAHPTYPHWYLPWFGVDPALQGGGIGSVLMARCLTLLDADRLPVYLETPNPRTIPFYRRHGFEVVGEARSGACPPLTLMLRAAG